MKNVTVHRIVLLVVDHEQAPAADVAMAVSNHRHFPGRVLSHVTAETEWAGDDHPLNKRIGAEDADAWLAANGAKEVAHG